MTRIALWFLRLAVLYLLVGVSLGLYMAASHDHSMHPVHAHLNLLGWVTLALFGLYYRATPSAAHTRLAQVHFWIYVPFHLAMMALLWTLFTGRPEVEPLLAVASIGVALGCACFAVVVWRQGAEGG